MKGISYKLGSNWNDKHIQLYNQDDNTRTSLSSLVIWLNKCKYYESYNWAITTTNHMISKLQLQARASPHLSNEFSKLPNLFGLRRNRHVWWSKVQQGHAPPESVLRKIHCGLRRRTSSTLPSQHTQGERERMLASCQSWYDHNFTLMPMQCGRQCHSHHHSRLRVCVVTLQLHEHVR